MQKNQAVNYDRIICDNGSGYVKLGYAGDSFPRFTFPSIVGNPALSAGASKLVGGGSIELKDIMIGDECDGKR